MKKYIRFLYDPESVSGSSALNWALARIHKKNPEQTPQTPTDKVQEKLQALKQWMSTDKRPKFIGNNAFTRNTDVIAVGTGVGGYKFHFTRLDDYNPETTPHKMEVSRQAMTLMTESNDPDADNIDKTNPVEMKEWLVNYLGKNTDVLSSLGIDDYQHMNPKQAIQLSSEIVTTHLEYDHEQVEYEKWITWFGRLTYGAHRNDNYWVPELLDNWKGVCRNYSQAIKAVFDAVKELQNPNTSMLVNSYCDYSYAENSYGLFDNIKVLGKNIIDNHAWNTFYTIPPSWEVQTTIVDATWADGDRGVKGLDHTDERFPFVLEDMTNRGLLTQEQKISQLINWHSVSRNETSPLYPIIEQEIWDYYLREKKWHAWLTWFINPSTGLSELQSTYGIPKEDLDKFAQHAVRLEMPKDLRFLTEYFYQEKDYEKAMGCGLKYKKHENAMHIDGNKREAITWSMSVLICASGIQLGKGNYFAYDPKSLYKDIDNQWIKKNYPKEAEMIFAKYGQWEESGIQQATERKNNATESNPPQVAQIESASYEPYNPHVDTFE